MAKKTKNYSIKNFSLFQLVVIIIVIHLFAAKGATGEEVSRFKPGSEPDGFNEIKWNTGINEIKEKMKMRFHGVQNKLDMYVIENDNLLVGDVRVSNIGYGFFKNRFTKVDIVVRDLESYEKLKREVFDRFGEAKETDEGHHIWEGQRSVAILTFRKVWFLTIYSKDIMLEAEGK